MLYFLLKTFLSALVIAAVSELSRRSSFAGALLASLPLTSLLAFVWLHHDTRDAEKVASLSNGIFWLVLPSLVLFLVLPLLLRRGVAFAPSLAISIAAMLAAYGAMAATLRALDIKL